MVMNYAYLERMLLETLVLLTMAFASLAMLSLHSMVELLAYRAHTLHSDCQ